MLLCYFATILAISSNEAARILAVFPIPSISHQVVFRPLTQALANRGHEVVVITPDPAFSKDTPPNLREIDVHDVSYKTLEKHIVEISEGERGFITQMTIIMDVVLKCVSQYSHNEAIRNLTTTKFDLLLVEAIARPALIFSHIHKVPVIEVSSFGTVFDNDDVMGIPTHPMLYPSIFRRRIHKLSMLEKVLEYRDFFLLNQLVSRHAEIEDTVLEQSFGYKFPSVKELSNNVDMMFLNVHPIVQGIKPVPPNVVYIGGIHKPLEKQLPMDLKNYLDSSKNGVIYMSLGTNCIPSLLPNKTQQAILKVFADLPYNVLMKYDKDELPGKTDNVRISKWFPQPGLLEHPNIKIFITQGGLQSTDEAITAGVPLIGIPLLGDQWFNVERYEYHKIGIKLDIETFDYDDLKNAINTVIGDDSYRRNVVKLRELMQDEPMKPLDRAIWWVEYVLRHGGAKHLRSPAANITWTEYLELELVLTLVAAFITLLSLAVALLVFIWKKIMNTSARDTIISKKNN